MKHSIVAVVSVAQLMVWLCACGASDNVCALASQHVVSCVPGKKAVQDPLCDPAAEAQAHQLLEMDCSGIQALVSLGKADMGFCLTFWDCPDEPAEETNNEDVGVSCVTDYGVCFLPAPEPVGTPCLCTNKYTHHSDHGTVQNEAAGKTNGDVEDPANCTPEQVIQMIKEGISTEVIESICNPAQEGQRCVTEQGVCFLPAPELVGIVCYCTSKYSGNSDEGTVQQ